MRFRSIDEVSPMIACGLVVSRTSICLVFSSVIAAAQEATNRERTPRETAVVAIVDSTAKSFEAKGFSGTRAWPTDSLADAVAKVPGVARAESWSVGHAAVAHPDGLMGNTFPVIAPPANTEMLKPRLLLGRWMRPGDGHAIVVNTRLIEDEPTIALGAEVPLIIGGTMAKWRVIGIAESGLSSNAFAARETFAPMSDGGRVDRAAVVATVRGRESQLDLIQRLRRDLQRGGFALQTTQLAQATCASVEDHLLMVVSFLGLMAQLMIVVGGLGVAATMSLAVLERTREIGVLRAIGARPKSILAMIHVEGLVIALASWIISLPLSIPMGIILSKAFGQIMFAVPVRYAPTLSGIIQWLIVVLVVSVVSCALPAFRATRITTASALAYE
jgi:putative ABC transport system permease protein